MAKELLSFTKGQVKLSITEDAGKIAVNIEEGVGGGDAAGIGKGKQSFELDAEMGLQLGEKVLNAHLPASVQPLALVIEGVANQAIKAIE